MTLDVQQILKVKGSEIKIIAWYNVSPAKLCYISRTYRLAEFKLSENYTTVYSLTRETYLKQWGQTFESQYLRRGLLCFFEILYKFSSGHRRYTTNVPFYVKIWPKLAHPL